MSERTIVKEVETVKASKLNNDTFDPFRLISNETFQTNLNAIIAYYQMSKGKNSRRFVSS